MHTLKSASSGLGGLLILGLLLSITPASESLKSSLTVWFFDFLVGSPAVALVNLVSDTFSVSCICVLLEGSTSGETNTGHVSTAAVSVRVSSGALLAIFSVTLSVVVVSLLGNSTAGGTLCFSLLSAEMNRKHHKNQMMDNEKGYNFNQPG